MTDTAFTPGPWHIHRGANHGESDLPWIGGHMGRPLAFVAHESILKSDLKRANANARLIAAAPELLEALEAIQLHACNHGGWVENDAWEGVSHMHKLASAAITKARGEA